MNIRNTAETLRLRRRWPRYAAPLVALALLLAAWRGDLSLPAPPPPTATVTMTNMLDFAPDTLYIEPGTEVTWENTSLLVHTVTADPEEASVEGSVVLPEGAEPFDSGKMDPEETFTHVFNEPGTWRYFCIPHEGTKMVGTVIVE